MSIRIAGATLVLALGACSTYGPEAAFDARSMPAPAAGATMIDAGGSISGGSEPVEKEKRGNTPPGMDRDGHGPAAGAIIDPTGAATRTKPY
jgi:hypothetical protein